ncbi:MAG: acyl-CoA dehydrogenase [Saprospiraceae bacterium]|nr:acyl-CoA dehydrogenase [Saprospiraceae bacterium]
MLFEQSQHSKDLLDRLRQFMKEKVYPLEKEFESFTDENHWVVFPQMESLKSQAKEAGLWNLFLPKDYGHLSPGLTNLEYAFLAEEMGRVLWASEIFNCSAPDTGNMEVLAKYGSEEQKEKWLGPLMEGKIRSAFLMTEPDVASSDATNIETQIQKEGEDYIVSGRKWWSTGAMHPDCKLYILMGKTNPAADKYVQQSMILIPRDTKGVKIVRPLKAYGTIDSPAGHAEILLDQVRVPKQNMILGEGRGFEIAQGRLGPGRIHHCMRLIGVAQRALELMCSRVTERETFGQKLARQSSIRIDIARSRVEIEQARLLTLSAAKAIDEKGIKGAKDLIAMIKIVCPSMACKVVDRAIQAFGGMGVCQDTPLAGFWIYGRSLRLADGPDEVHMYQLGRNTIKQWSK